MLPPIWLALFYGTPMIALILVFWMVQPSVPISNAYGPPPVV